MVLRWLVVFGVGVFWYAVPAWERELAEVLGSAWTVAGAAIAIALVLAVLGLRFVEFVDWVAWGMMLGGALAAGIALFTDQWAYVLPMLLHVLAGALLSNRQDAVVERRWLQQREAQTKQQLQAERRRRGGGHLPG